jgi:hypothetical protein
MATGPIMRLVIEETANAGITVFAGISARLYKTCTRTRDSALDDGHAKSIRVLPFADAGNLCHREFLESLDRPVPLPPCFEPTGLLSKRAQFSQLFLPPIRETEERARTALGHS